LQAINNQPLVLDVSRGVRLKGLKQLLFRRRQSHGWLFKPAADY
jgi:hypothetical protein